MIHIVDDEEILRDLLSLIAEELGFRSKTFARPTEYIGYMESAHYQPPSVVLTDITMPGDLTGYDLIEKIRQQYPEQLCVVMSGDGSAPNRHKNLACMYLQKPFAAEKLQAVMTAIASCLSGGGDYASSCCSADDRPQFCLHHWHCPHST